MAKWHHNSNRALIVVWMQACYEYTSQSVYVVIVTIRACCISIITLSHASSHCVDIDIILSGNPVDDVCPQFTLGLDEGHHVAQHFRLSSRLTPLPSLFAAVHFPLQATMSSLSLVARASRLARTSLATPTLTTTRSLSTDIPCSIDGRGYANGSIDVHTHCYLPSYMKMLRSRKEVPYVIAGKNPGDDERYVILPGEDLDSTSAVGRPIGAEYFSVEQKIAYMDRHGIDVSVMSLANPWLDFLPAAEATYMATELNDDLQTLCEDSAGRLAGFAVLPIVDVEASCKEVERLAKLDKIKGVILGTSGSGKGLDHEEMEPLWATLAKTKTPVFLHPHYGIGNEHFANTGHSLFLALGFPFETTVATSRLILSGVFDRHKDLKLLLAHSGGTLPFLAGRLDSCVEHDVEVCDKLEHEPSHYLKTNFYYVRRRKM
jgi:aminocarboxymuconate-semialdehyde decarboxylase